MVDSVSSLLSVTFDKTTLVINSVKNNSASKIKYSCAQRAARIQSIGDP